MIVWRFAEVDQNPVEFLHLLLALRCGMPYAQRDLSSNAEAIALATAALRK